MSYSGIIEQSALDRFPMLTNDLVKFINVGNPRSNIINLGNNINSFYIDNCSMSSACDGVVRAKYINGMIFVNKKTTQQKLKDCISRIAPSSVDPNNVFGVRIIINESIEDFIIASHLQSLYLSDNIHETTIGDYLNRHKKILNYALDIVDFVYEPNLEWLEKTEDNTDTAINPDAMLKRKDGHFDICDFKTALMKTSNLTSPTRARRTFKKCIYDGISQLNNYEEYFTFKKNQEHAKEKYKITVNNPQKILIIGNYENYKEIEVKQALRGIPNTVVIDYDSIITLFLKKSQKIHS